MKKLGVALFLILAMAIVPLTAAHAQAPPAPTCTPAYTGQPGLQASYTSAKTGATYATAAWVVSNVVIRTGVSATVTVQVFNATSDEQTCLAPVDTFTLQFSNRSGSTLFTTYFASGYTPASLITALKNHPQVSAALASSTSITF